MKNYVVRTFLKYFLMFHAQGLSTYRKFYPIDINYNRGVTKQKSNEILHHTSLRTFFPGCFSNKINFSEMIMIMFSSIPHEMKYVHSCGNTSVYLCTFNEKKPKHCTIKVYCVIELLVYKLQINHLK